MQVISFPQTEQIRQTILLKILSGQVRPGQRLLEAKLSKELGVGQASVNSALVDLYQQGIVTKLLNRSTNVSQYTAADIDKLFAVRLVLEPVAAAAVAAVWSDEGRQRLLEQVDLMRRAARSQDLPNFFLADYTFHQKLYRLSGNPFLIQACQAIAAAPFAYILCNHLEALPTDYLVLAQDHQVLIEAMAKGPEIAARVTRERVLEWRAHALRALLGAHTTAASR